MRKQKQNRLSSKCLSLFLVVGFVLFACVGLVGMGYLFLLAFGTQNQFLVVLSLTLFGLALFGGIYYLYQIFCEF